MEAEAAALLGKYIGAGLACTGMALQHPLEIARQDNRIPVTSSPSPRKAKP